MSKLCETIEPPLVQACPACEQTLGEHIQLRERLVSNTQVLYLVLRYTCPKCEFVKVLYLPRPEPDPMAGIRSLIEGPSPV